jgi:anti-anti-sigma factor
MPAKIEMTGEIARIALIGNLDFSTQRGLDEAFNRALSTDLAKEIQIDMTNATFIDSAVIRALLQLQELAIAKKKSLSIWNCNDRIREVFAIGGFDQMFVIH